MFEGGVVWDMVYCCVDVAGCNSLAVSISAARIFGELGFACTASRFALVWWCSVMVREDGGSASELMCWEWVCYGTLEWDWSCIFGWGV